MLVGSNLNNLFKKQAIRKKLDKVNLPKVKYYKVNNTKLLYRVLLYCKIKGVKSVVTKNKALLEKKPYFYKKYIDIIICKKKLLISETTKEDIEGLFEEQGLLAEKFIKVRWIKMIKNRYYCVYKKKEYKSRIEAK